MEGCITMSDVEYHTKFGQLRNDFSDSELSSLEPAKREQLDKALEAGRVEAAADAEYAEADRALKALARDIRDTETEFYALQPKRSQIDNARDFIAQGQID